MLEQQLKLKSDGKMEIKIQKSERSTAAAEARLTKIEEEIADIKKQLEQASQDRLEESRRIYESHVQSKKNLAELREQIKALNAEIVDQAGIEAERSSLASKQQALWTSYSENKGVLQQLSSRLDELCQSLDDPAYKQIEMKRADLAIQYNLTAAQIAEWNAEHDALDAGLMQYHHDKMIEINR